MIQEFFSEVNKKFMRDHANDDPVSLLLQFGKHPDLSIKELVHQISARQKLRKKLPDWVNNENIFFPSSLSQEQSSSQKTAEYKAKLISGQTLIDLSGGAGVDSFYLSRSFGEVYYVEPNKELFEITKYNHIQLGAANISHFSETASEFLTRDIAASFVFVDPDRRGNNNKKLHLLSECEPDVINLLPDIWVKTSLLLIKASPFLDISEMIKELPEASEIHVVAVNNEVKEILCLVKKGFIAEPLLYAVNITGEDVQVLTFKYSEEKEKESAFDLPQAYLYEPNASILKSGAFKTVGEQYKVGKLHPNTHIYTSQALITEFPGRKFKILAVLPYQKKKILPFILSKKANITARNFPGSVQEVRNKLGLKEGGEIYLFAVSDINNKPVVIICEKA